MRPFLEVRREYIEASFAAVREEWGEFDRYLHEGLGITEKQRDALREQLLV
jgi:protein-tyrosine phosphatase